MPHCVATPLDSGQATRSPSLAPVCGLNVLTEPSQEPPLPQPPGLYRWQLVLSARLEDSVFFLLAFLPSKISRTCFEFRKFEVVDSRLLFLVFKKLHIFGIMHEMFFLPLPSTLVFFFFFSWMFLLNKYLLRIQYFPDPGAIAVEKTVLVQSLASHGLGGQNRELADRSEVEEELTQVKCC